jgi:adenylylsulfate kinase-like enzyme
LSALKPAIVVWFTGLPGSGKTTIARGVFDQTRQSFENYPDRPSLALVEMDSIRKKIFPNPTYSDEERDVAYRAFVVMGSLLSVNNVATLLDGTGHKRVWRQLAREQCPNFVEVYMKCRLEICIERESKRAGDKARQKLYRDALDRLKTGEKIGGLGNVPGINEPFEETPYPEIIIDSSDNSPEKLITQALRELARYDPRLFYIGDRN